MERRTKIGIAWGIVALALSGTSYYVFVHEGKDGKTAVKRLKEGRGMTREDAIEIISVYLGSKLTVAPTIETEYLVERAKAIKEGREMFSLRDKYYSTKTGKAI